MRSFQFSLEIAKRLVKVAAERRVGYMNQSGNCHTNIRFYCRVTSMPVLETLVELVSKLVSPH